MDILNEFDILTMSDTHGYLPKIETPFDLLLICGDISPAHDHYYAYQINWFQHEFANWINTLPFKNEWSKVVFTWGNHDFVGQRISKEEKQCFNITTNNKVVILKNEEYNHEYLTDYGIKTLKIFGTPYCKIFGNWAFMVSNEKLKQKYDFIPNDCDILLTHDAPDINDLGMINTGRHKGTNAGNIILAETIKRKKPKYVFCGHIHSGNHNLEKIDDIWMCNVSYVNESYIPEHGIQKLIINGLTKELINEERRFT